MREAEPLFDWAVKKGLWGEGEVELKRPKTRGDCVDGIRPCPWVSCRHHLYLDVKESGLVRWNFPGKELDQLAETCSLDVGDREKKLSLEQVGDLVNLTRERVHLIVLHAQGQLRVELDDDDGDNDA